MFKIKRGRRLIVQSVGVVAVGGALALAVATVGSATPPPPTFKVTLHQTPPITAAGYGGNGTDCGNASNQDGWFFVLPTNDEAFSSLDITFSPPGSIISGPTFLHGGKQATFVTTAGAVLESGSGFVTTADNLAPDHSWFNLSHTCAAKSSSSPSPKPSGSPSGSPGPSGSPHPSHSPHPSGSPSSPPPGAPPPTPVHTNLPVTG